MRIPSGVTDQYIYFVAVDATDLKTREPGLTGFTVYRSRNGGVAAAMTTPTINETDTTNMPGVYELLLDEDMTIDAGDDSQEMAFHITQASMAPVTRVIELYRAKITAGNTLDVTATGAAGIDWANVEGQATSVNLSSTTTNLVNTTTTNTDMRGTDNALLAANAPTNFSDLAITVTTGYVTVGTNNDKTGYSLTQTFPTNFADLSITATTGRMDVGSWLGTAVTTSATTNKPEVDINSISDDAVAANNAESFFDGTGYAGTNNVIPTVTTLTNLPAITTDWLTAAGLATDAVNEIRDAILPTQNAVFNNIAFLFVAASDHVTPVTGATGTAVTRSIDGGAFGAGTGTLAEVANGIYQYDASAADMNGGIITFRFTATGGTPGAPDDRFLTVVTGGGV